MKKLVLFFLGLSINLYSQSTEENAASKYIQNILPSSPESFKFSTHGNIPIGLFTGVPNFTVPVTDFLLKEIKIPITLNYSSNGVNIDQMNGSVGLGWSFVSAGVITKTVRDKPDENNNYVPLNVPELDYDNPDSISELTEYLKNAEDDNYDTEPDIYMANFSGNSISFFIDRFGEIIYVNQGGYIVKKDYGGNLFSIITEDGIQYNFNDTERIMNRISGAGHSIPSTSIQSWYLSSIKNIHGDEVSISYNDINYTTTISKSQTTTFTEGIQEKYNSVCRVIPYTFDINHFGNIIESNQTVHGKQISKISNGNNSIEFSYNSQNNDYPILKRIIKRDGSSIITDIELDYFRTLNDRLFLVNIIDNLSSSFHKFEYYNPDDLPVRLAFSRDKWGYYNGQYNNVLIPKNININDVPPSAINNLNIPSYNGANQEVNPGMGFYGLLKKITYPTGGTTFLNYENHVVDSFKVIPPKYETTWIEVVNSANNTLSSDQKSFIPKENGYFKINLSVSYSEDGKCYNSPHNLALKNLATLSVKDEFGNYQGIYQLVRGVYTFEGTRAEVRNGASKELYVYGSAGKEFTADLRINWFCTSATVHISYINLPSYTVPTEIEIGGYRVASTIDDPINGDVITKKYKYLKEDGSKSIYIAKYPIFIDDNISISECSIGSLPVESYYKSITSSNINSLFSFHPNIFYGSVIEEIEGKGSIIHFYNTDVDEIAYTINGFKKYSAPNSNTAWMNGKEIRTVFKDKNGKLIKAINNNYFIDSNKTSYLGAISRSKIYEPILSNDTWNGFRNLNISYYKNFSRFTYLKSQNTIEYFDDKNIITEIIYNYDSPNHFQLTKQTSKNSKGEAIITEYQYPPDWRGNTMADELTAQNRIADPLKINTFNGTTLLSSTYNEYSKFNGILQKSRIFEKKGSEDYQESDVVIYYNSYDTHGNITQYTLANGVPVSIIWGYNGQYPILKVEGIALNDIPQWLIDYIKHPSDWGANNTELSVRLNYQRNEPYFKDAMVTGYVYKPLVGVTEIIQPNGQTEFYEYDSANRLKSIKNSQGEILKTFEYHYKP